MKVIVYDKNTKKGEFNNYGYGKLKLIEKCEVTEELNGRYDLELIVNREDSKVNYLKKWVIIYCDGQLFRIIEKFDNDKDNTIKVFCKHIFYDLNYGFIEDNRAVDCNVKAAMQVALPKDFEKDFVVDSDIEDINTLYFVKNYGADSMFDIIERWEQGELVRDNFNVSIKKAKGLDKGVTFTYKKIDAIEISEETENVVTRLYPTGKDGIRLEEKYIEIPNWNEEDYPPFHITREVKFEEVEGEGELRDLAKKEAEKIGLSKVNFTINVSELANTSLYKHMPNLMQVEVGDIVTIKHNKLDVRVKVKCIKKTHEKVKDTVKLEFGQPSSNFFDSVDNTNVSIAMPNLTKYEDNMFYYSNGKKITIKGDKLIKDAYLTYGVNDTVNLILYYNAFVEVVESCTIQMEIRIDNELISFSPKFTMETGFRNISFTFPLMNTSGGVSHSLEIKYKIVPNEDGLTPGLIYIEKEHEHVIVRGQNISASLAQEPPHAEVEEIYKFEEYTFKKYDGNASTNVEIIISKPNTIICDEIKNFDKAENLEENLKTKDQVDCIKNF